MKKCIGIVLFVIVGAFLYVYIPSVRAQNVMPRTHTVCPQSGTGCTLVGNSGIQQAINQAKTGDIVEIRAGSCTTDISISSKGILVQGAGKGKTTINGRVQMSGVLTTIMQLGKITIQNSTNTGITITGAPTVAFDRVEVLNHA